MIRRLMSSRIAIPLLLATTTTLLLQIIIPISVKQAVNYIFP